MTQPTPADNTAAIEIWARLLNAADIHVYGPEHAQWRNLASNLQDQYRKAAAWLLPRLTIQPDAIQQKLTERAERAEAELVALKTIATGYCPECGRGDCSPTAQQWLDQRDRANKAEAAIARVRALHVRNGHTGDCEHCSAGDYPDYAVPDPCPTTRALNGTT